MRARVSCRPCCAESARGAVSPASATDLEWAERALGRRARPNIVSEHRADSGHLVPTMAEVSLTGGFWGRMAGVHRGPALEHQWAHLKASGALECFAVAAGRSDGVVSRDFTSDSDVHKWLDAVSRIPPSLRSAELAGCFEDVLDLVGAVQDADGYCNTWIQGLFPAGRFLNLETEHEQYTLGHLIEAGVSHHEVTGEVRLLDMARRSADLLVREFAGAPASKAVGHEGVEIALVRLYRATGEASYRDLAAQLVEQRGSVPGVQRRFVVCVTRTAGRLLHHARLKRKHRRDHPLMPRPERAPRLQVSVTPDIARRTIAAFVSGRWAQTDRPVRDLTVPTGHAVCFQYLQTAVAMLARHSGDESLVAATTTVWDRLVEGHLFVNGGAGAFPGVEGFGDQYDLDPERAYAETCASLAGVFWNRELGLLTGEARYDDLLEWQLLNGVGVGVNIDGTAYHYNNPLQAQPGFSRRAWYPIPCCPSNVSRTWAALGTLQFSRLGNELRVHQFFSSRTRFGDADIEVDSGLPWSGDVIVRVAAGPDGPRRIAFRVPSWAPAVTVRLDDVEMDVETDVEVEDRAAPRATASGLDPWQARWARVDLPDWNATLHISFEMPVRFLEQDRRVPRVGGKVAVTRGPLLYCLEGVDHPGLAGPALNDVELDRAAIVDTFDPDLLGGAVEVRAESTSGLPLRFVPYFLWGNRGATGMTAFVR